MVQHYTFTDCRKAFIYAVHNKAKLKQSKTAGCCFCMETFPAEIVKEFIDPAEDTALCPVCGVDAVIGDYELPYSLDDPSFLDHMNWHGYCHVLVNGRFTQTVPPRCSKCAADIDTAYSEY